uniref:Glutaredoxin domain-containing protein n=1 Tax=Angiostrongylus cantonensis TaxID=6313 RepID=A0A0K0D039_ANGCA
MLGFNDYYIAGLFDCNIFVRTMARWIKSIAKMIAAGIFVSKTTFTFTKAVAMGYLKNDCSFIDFVTCESGAVVSVSVQELCEQWKIQNYPMQHVDAFATGCDMVHYVTRTNGVALKLIVVLGKSCPDSLPGAHSIQLNSL